MNLKIAITNEQGEVYETGGLIRARSGELFVLTDQTRETIQLTALVMDAELWEQATAETREALNEGPDYDSRWEEAGAFEQETVAAVAFHADPANEGEYPHNTLDCSVCEAAAERQEATQ